MLMRQFKTHPIRFLIKSNVHSNNSIMKFFQIVLLPALFLGSQFSPIFGQSASYKFPEKVIFKQGRIFQTGKAQLKVKNLEIYQDKLSYIDLNFNQHKTTQLTNDIYLIQVRKGNQALKFGLLSGLGAGLAGAWWVSNYNSDPFREEIKGGLIIATSFLGGATLGALFGLGATKWSTIYENGKVKLSWQPGSRENAGLAMLQLQF